MKQRSAANFQLPLLFAAMAMRILVWVYEFNGFHNWRDRLERDGFRLASNQFATGDDEVVTYRPTFVDVEVALSFGGITLVKSPACHALSWEWGFSAATDLWMLSPFPRPGKPRYSLPTACDMGTRLIRFVSPDECAGFYPVRQEREIGQAFFVWSFAQEHQEDFPRCSGWLFSWDPRWHRHAPEDIKKAVLTVTQLRSLAPDSVWAPLPNELLFQVFYWLG